MGFPMTYDSFKEKWRKKIRQELGLKPGEPLPKREEAFINGRRGDYSKIWGFYDDYRTGERISFENYWNDITE